MVAGAAGRVAEMIHARAPARRAELVAELAELDARPRATAARERRRAKVRRALHQLGGQGPAGWRWKLITIAPQWDPTAAYSYSVEGLRARFESLRDRWRALWDGGMDAGGLAAAYFRVEMSVGGHVHAHVLYHGPWVVKDWAARTAGCFVDVRAVEGADADTALRDAVREAVKYTLKSPSVLRRAWVIGDGAQGRYRVAHPELAAAWVLALRSRRTVEAYGVMRAAVAAQSATTPPEGDRAPAPVVCGSCGSVDLSEARVERVATIARFVWSFGRCAKTPWGQALPPKVTVMRV
jgi:hypothetical protein